MTQQKYSCVDWYFLEILEREEGDTNFPVNLASYYQLNTANNKFVYLFFSLYQITIATQLALFEKGAK